MQLRSFALMASAVVGALVATTSPASAAVTVPKYFCETNADCEANYPDTICIEVDNNSEITKKCTPNTKERPACFGTQPGLCPSYQSPDIGYLNVHCVFVAKDPDAKAEVAVASAKASGSGSGKAAARRGRYLMLAATNATTAPPAGVVKASSAEGSTVGDVVIDDGAGGAATTPAVVSGGYVKVKIGKEMVTGMFKCVDVSDCDNQAYDPTTCSPLACGSPTSDMQCNNHGTCTYPSIQTMGKRSCKCYAGYGGDKCQQEISNECDVDCGFGGDCINGECKCKKGFDGALFKGKKGKPNQRCTKCTNDQACQNDNACDTETGVCVCSPGFNGPTCGGTEDSCTKKDCGIGSCKVFGNSSSACYCPVCAPDCEICKAKDCSTCPAALASAISTSKLVVLLSAVALMVGNLLV